MWKIDMWLENSWKKTYDNDWKIHMPHRLFWICIMFSPIAIFIVLLQ